MEVDCIEGIAIVDRAGTSSKGWGGVGWVWVEWSGVDQSEVSRERERERALLLGLSWAWDGSLLIYWESLQKIYIYIYGKSAGMGAPAEQLVVCSPTRKHHKLLA